MYTITTWDRKSANFNANSFVKANGTDFIETMSRDSALRLMGSIIRNPDIDRAEFNGPNGRLIWIQHRADEPCECDECDNDGDDCDCEGSR